MFGSTVLEVAIGLMFTFLMISLVTSAVTEALASVMGWRANTLLDGVKSLLNDQNFTGLAKDIYNHALVNPRENGAAKTEAELKSTPSYIDTTQFAAAFTQLVGLTPAAAGAVAAGNSAAAVAGLKAQVAKISDPQLQQMLTGIVDRTAGDLDKIQAEVGKWFDTGMERVSGVYKRHTQAWRHRPSRSSRLPTCPTVGPQRTGLRRLWRDQACSPDG